MNDTADCIAILMNALNYADKYYKTIYGNFFSGQPSSAHP